MDSPHHSSTPLTGLTEMVKSKLTRKTFLACAAFALVSGCLLLNPSQVVAQQSLNARTVLLKSDPPYSFPEKMIAGPDRGYYFLDTNLSSIFFLNPQTGAVSSLCGPSSLSSPSDLALDHKGSFWILTKGGTKITRLDRQCTKLREVDLPQRALKLAVNSFGEGIVLTQTGPALFLLVAPDGKVIRSFGERIDYKDEITNNELSDGHLAADNSGGFFFSFNYPPLIRHYSRSGRLITEFKPESDIAIGPPNITVKNFSNSFSISAKYQILVLDIASEGGRLYLLMSGKNKVPALHEGTPKLRVVTNKGVTVKDFVLAHSFHRLVVRNGRLYLMRNRAPFRVDEYAGL